MTTAAGRSARVEIVEVGGNPDDKELRAVRHALEHIMGAERKASSGALWPLAARPYSGRLGTVDYRDEVDREDAWRLSARAETRRTGGRTNL